MYDPSESYSLVVPPKTVAEALASQTLAWDWPEGANTKGDPTKPGPGEAYWMEPTLEIVKSQIGPDKNDSSVVGIQIDVVAPLGSGSKNEGKRALRLFYRLWPAAIGNKDHAKFQATEINLGNLMVLLRALGLDMGGVTEGVDLGLYFAPSAAGPPFVLNKRVGAMLRARWYNGRRQTDAIEFVASA